jgi:predicted dehydrogenase
VIGAGNFAKSVLLPALKKMDGFQLLGVATASGPSAQQTAERFGFAYAATDWRALMEDPDLDAILIATRHDLHARIATAALEAGKAVFLEKPMALDAAQLQGVLDAWRSSGRVLQVGFNRRFAPTSVRLKTFLADRRAPLSLVYRVNAGSVAPTSWVVDPVQGGGRVIGEVCHMVDLLAYLIDAAVTSVYAQPMGGTNAADDSVMLSLRFEDGSLGSIVYASGADRSMPKERLEVLGSGRAAVLDDFRTLQLHAGGRAQRDGGVLSSQDKGHATELRAFLDAVRNGRPSPVDPLQAAHVTRVTFAAVESMRTGLPVPL